MVEKVNTSEDFTILTQADIDHYMKINSHVWKRLSRVTITHFPARVEIKKNRRGVYIIKHIEKTYNVASFNRFHTGIVTRSNVYHQDRPWCQICDEEFEAGDEVYTVRSKTTTTAERRRIGSDFRTRWYHKECGDSKWENVPIQEHKKIGRVKGAQGLLKLVVPIENDKRDWATDEDLFRAVAEFFKEKKESAINSELNKFLTKYENRLIIQETAKTGICRYRWRDERAWMAKKDTTKYSSYVEKF